MATTQQNPKRTTYSKKKIATIVSVILIVTLAAVTTALLTTNHNSSSSQAGNQKSSQSWITKGAYATYEGQATVLSMSVSYNAKLEIVDFNETHIQVMNDFNMSTPFGSSENSTTAWVSRENMTFQPDGLTLNNTYIAQVALPNLGTRSCTVYEYSNQDISATYYVDNNVQWPVKMMMTSPTVNGQSYNMDINLVDSNIPGL